MASESRSSNASSSSALSLFRFSLALMVMGEHLSGREPIQTGRLAVEAFFCISGFLITMVASTRYAGRARAFLTNRFLRIFPTYWACLAVGFIVVIVTPHAVVLHPSLKLPASVGDWVANLAVFGLTQNTMSRVLPAAWSLHTELWFYLIIGLVTAARPRLTYVLLPFAIALSAFCAFGPSPFQFYGTPIGNAHAFFIGSATFLLRDRLRPAYPKATALVGLAAFEFLAWGPCLPTHTVNEYLGAPATAILLIGLWNSDIDRVLARYKGPINMLGRLSYPLFLVHWSLGGMVVALTGLWQGPKLFFVAGALSFAVSYLILRFVEDPLVGLRSAIRTSDRALPAAVAAQTD